MARVRRAIALVALVLASLAAPAARESRGEAEALREIRARIERLQQELAASEKSRGDALGELRESEKAVSDAHRTLFELRRDRATLEQGLAALAERERQVRESSARQQALAERLLRLQYEQGGADRLRLILEGRDAATVARHMTYLQYIQKARAETIAELREKAERLEALDRQARAQRDELAANHEEQERQARVLEKERAARLAAVNKLAADIEKGRREMGRLKRDEGRLARLVEEITKALAAKPAPKAQGGRRIDRVADASLAAKPFESLKGRLRLPVRGELANQFGTPRDETGVQWKGLFIRCATGETVHAIADGRVVYADWLRGFGNLLILDHGGGYMSLYANNEGLVRQVGDSVRSGDAVAQAGSSGGSAESGLYFELRRGGKPFDPMKWVAL